LFVFNDFNAILFRVAAKAPVASDKRGRSCRCFPKNKTCRQPLWQEIVGFA
jgi:hypothetical protein